MSMPSSRVTEKKSSSVSARSTWAPTLSRTSTFKQSDCISLIRTLKDSGIPAPQVLALHDRLVGALAALHVVGFDGQKFLQRVGGAVGLEGPDFHLPEALTTNCALPPSGWAVIIEYGPVERAWILSSTMWANFKM